ncbi:asparagine synthetase B [Oceanospirillaceae bacterium]|nr:asparagine synthetase B [Oceanospirillaceae bacterium]
MCGFFITNNQKIGLNQECVIEKFLRFRGPDGSSGLITHNTWKAYHSRLSIIDLNAGTNQPMIDVFGGLLVFNGEILNFEELGFKYFNKKYISDTSLLSDLLMNGNIDVDELDGFFSFVYIDNNGVLTHAVRDKFGVKPLYYYEDDDGLSFCSEPNVLNKLYKTQPNSEAIDEYYAIRAPIFSGSYFEGVKSIEPGSCFVNGIYFDCRDYIEKGYEAYNKMDLKSALNKGIVSRLVSDAPVGLLLSRGIDSNLLKSLGSFDKYYTIGFDGDEDLVYLKSKNIINLTSIECSREEYLNAFKYLLELRGEPMSVPNEVLLYIISKKASSDGIKVLLSGEGADEFFGGYDRIFKWAHQAKEFNLEIFLDKYCYLPPSKNSKLYCKFETLFSLNKFDSVFETVRWFFIRYHMPILFRRLDFSLMAAGVEGREPIANMHTFIKAMKLSPDDLMGEILGKIPLRKVTSDYLGHEFSYEQKIGFPVDLTKIFDNENNLSSYQIWFKENLKVLL